MQHIPGWFTPDTDIIVDLIILAIAIGIAIPSILVLAISARLQRLGLMLKSLFASLK